MTNILIVGSGASGVHFALTVLGKGHQVTMLDVGWSKPAPTNPEDTFVELKENLKDPVRYFLGEQFESVAQPGFKDDYVTKYYGTPPSKSHVFDRPTNFKYQAQGMVPLLSFARGGLAEAWTGGAYPLNDEDLKEFPFSYQDIAPHYGEVARRIGLVGVDDDLARFFPLHDNLMKPLELDAHSEQLVEQYERRKTQLNKTYGCYLGRSRVTTHSHDNGERKGCTYCGRCLWGCPSEALYTPSITLRDCQQFTNFHYVPGHFVNHFEYDSAGHIERIVAESIKSKSRKEFVADSYVLAAGTISSSKIYLDSIYRRSGEIEKLAGLMDNRQILVPFLNLRMLGRQPNFNSYQYHQLAIGIEMGAADEYVHGQITTLKSASVHPIIQNLPFDLRTASTVFRNLRAGLGVVNLNLSDHRRQSNCVTLTPTDNGSTELKIHYEPPQSERQTIDRTLKIVKRFLWRLGCVVPPGMTHVRPMGASVHYTGTIPMSEEKNGHTASEFCRSHIFPNLYFVDGTTFPFLPAKNITFSLMANAVRVANLAF